MNFFQPARPLTGWTDMPAFTLTMILMIVTPFIMFLWARRRGWM
jgi:hypothetical protein